MRARTRRLLAGMATLGAAATVAAPALARWGTISDEAYQGGMVCRDGMDFDFGTFTSGDIPPPSPPFDTRLAITWAAPVNGSPVVPDPPPSTTTFDPLPARKYPNVAFDQHLTVYYNPKRNVSIGDGATINLVYQTPYSINWRKPRNPGDTVRLVFDYPDPNDQTVDIGASPDSLVIVQDCLLPRIRVKSGGVPTIDEHSTGTTPVTVLSNAKFDARSVVPSTIWFGSAVEKIQALSSQLVDVNHDGRLDRRFVYRTSSLTLPCGATTAYIAGNAGTRFIATAPVNVINCPPGT